MTTALGLPRTLRDVNFDAVVVLPDSLNGFNEILPEHTDLDLTATNAHAKLCCIMAHAIESSHPVTKPVCQKNGFYGVEYRKVAEIEDNLEAWYRALTSSPSLGFNSDADPRKLRFVLLLSCTLALISNLPTLPRLCSKNFAQDLGPRIANSARSCRVQLISGKQEISWNLTS